MPIALFIQLLVGLLFSPAIIKAVMGAAGAATDSISSATSTNPVTATVQAVVPSTNANATAEQSPSAAQVIQEGMKKPANWFGLALLGGAGVFVIAQLRAGAHEAGSAVVDTYKEAKATTAATHQALKKPDVANQSRRLN